MISDKMPMSKSWKVTIAMILVAVVSILLPSIGIDLIDDSQIQNLIYMALGISAIGVGNKSVKRIIEKKEKPRKNQTSLQEKLHQLENNPLENLKNRIGLATDEPMYVVMEQMTTLGKKSKATHDALKLTKADFELVGLIAPSSLS